MERDKEITKLVNVLHRIVRAASYAAWNKAQPDALRLCASQFNKVFRRLKELEPAVAPLFTELSETASPEVTRIAARELAAYFEEEPEAAEVGERGRHPHRARHCGGRPVVFGWSV